MDHIGGVGALLRVLRFALGVLVFGLMAITAIDVVGRGMFDLPVPASYEFTRLALGLMVFVALPLVSAADEHVSIGLLNDFFPGRSARVKQFVVSLFVAFLCLVLARELWIQAGALRQQNERLMYLGIQLAPFVYAMSVLSLLAALIHAVQAWLKLAGRFTSNPEAGV